jgi:putative ABC transport system permease protein
MPSWLRRLIARLRYRRYADDLREELRVHREMHEDDLVSRGFAAERARDAAHRVMGNELQAREDARAVWLAPWLDQTLSDVRVAWRQIRRAPAFAVTAVLLSGLGVGATTAVFSVVNAVLVEPLPYPEPHRILVLGTRQGGAADGQTFHAARARSTAFSSIGAQRQTGGFSLVAGTYAESVRALRVSADYFAALGVPPRVGRPFTTSEDTAGGPDVAVISDALWRRAFGGRSDVLGEQVLLGGTPHQVIGVMPDAFHSTPAVDVWTPLRLSDRDNSVNYFVLGRLAPAATANLAGAELELAKADLMAVQPAPMHPRTQSLAWTPMASRLGLELAVPLLLLVLAVGAMTAVACANLTGLLLFRTLARQREVATRLALGGTQGRIVRQFLTESLVLAALGGAASVAVAAWAMPALTRLVPATLLVGRNVALDGTVLMVAVGMTVAVGVLFGLAPAMAAKRVDVRAVAGQGSGASRAPHQRWARRVLVAGEIAATAMLLVLGGMLTQSLAQMYRANLGFDPTSVTVAKSSMSGTVFADPAKYRAFVERALEALRAIPGVDSAAVANAVPIERGLNLPVDPSTGHLVSTARSVDWRYVSNDYFATLSMTVRRGRAFDARDGAGAAPTAIVNEAFARTYFGRDDVVSQTLRMGESVGDVPREIVGVVQDSRSRPGAGWTRGLNARGSDMPPIVYVPVAQAPARTLSVSHRSFPVAWLVRTRPGAAYVAEAVAQAVRGVEPSVAFVSVEPLSRVVDDDVQGARVVSTLVATLSALSLGIAATGIFGLVAYTTALRRRETAVRVALGASRTSLVRGFLGETVAIAIAGTAMGVVLALGASRLLQAILGSLAALHSFTVVLAAVCLLLTVVLAGTWPALRASRADPIRALRAE